MAGAARPNIVLVITHDTGTHLGCYGAGVATPQLDALAAEGVQFQQMHCTAPQCSPSRASLLTGQYPHTNGMMGLAHRGWELRPDVRCLPQYLADGGYATYLFGFQHEAYQHPERLGYQHIDTSAIKASVVAEKVRTCIDSQPDAPFFIMAGFDETHRPFDRPGYDCRSARGRHRAAVAAGYSASARGDRPTEWHGQGGRCGGRGDSRRDCPPPAGGQYALHLHDRPRHRHAARQGDALRTGHAHRPPDALAHRLRGRAADRRPARQCGHAAHPARRGQICQSPPGCTGAPSSRSCATSRTARTIMSSPK